MTSARKLFTWLPATLWAGTIFFLSSQSTLPDLNPGMSQFDKVEHFGAYGLLGLLVFAALLRSTKLTLPKIAVLTILITSAYGVSDEFHQRYVPGRSCDVMDWTTDTVAGAVSALVFVIYESRRRQETHR